MTLFALALAKGRSLNYPEIRAVALQHNFSVGGAAAVKLCERWRAATGTTALSTLFAAYPPLTAGAGWLGALVASLLVSRRQSERRGRTNTGEYVKRALN